MSKIEELPTTEVTRLLENMQTCATSGRWCQFHPDYCKPEWQQARDSGAIERYDLDTSHDSSAVVSDEHGFVARFKGLAQWKHANDAAFAESLVNLWRAGRLQVIEKP